MGFFRWIYFFRDWIAFYLSISSYLIATGDTIILFSATEITGIDVILLFLLFTLTGLFYLEYTDINALKNYQYQVIDSEHNLTMEKIDGSGPRVIWGQSKNFYMITFFLMLL